MRRETFTLDLPGLREDVARDFLAAAGLLRLLDLRWPELATKLAWNSDQGHPRLLAESPLPENWCEQIVAIVKSLEEDNESPLFHGEVIKAEYRVYREAIRKGIRFSESGHPLAKLPEHLFAAYGGQVADPKTGMIDATMLSFSNGQGGKLLLRDVRELVRAWDAVETLAALQGTAKPSAAKSFRWMPQEYRPAALRAHNPGSGIRGDESLDYPPLNILAFFGLSCIPTASRIDGVDTAAFSRDEHGWSFRWPIWDGALAVSEMIALLCLPESYLASLPGVLRVWTSRRLVAEKSVYFSPAVLA
jgi:hypothetical protein